MEWQFLLLSAAVGAIAGGLGWFITRNAKEPAGRRTQIVRISSIVIGLVVGQQIVNPIAKDWKTRRELHMAALEMYGNEEAATLNTEVFFPVIRDPRFGKRIKQQKAHSPKGFALQAKDWNVVTDMSAMGMARLEIADVAAIFEVKRALAEKSPALCAGFWSGQISGDDLRTGLRGLPREQQALWITVSGRALSAEIAADGPPPPEPAATAGTEAMTALMRALSPPQQAAFTAAAQGAPTPDAACKAFRALATGMQKIPAAKRDVILRMLSAAPSGDKP